MAYQVDVAAAHQAVWALNHPARASSPDAGLKHWLMALQDIHGSKCPSWRKRCTTAVVTPTALRHACTPGPWRLLLRPPLGPHQVRARRLDRLNRWMLHYTHHLYAQMATVTLAPVSLAPFQRVPPQRGFVHPLRRSYLLSVELEHGLLHDTRWIRAGGVNHQRDNVPSALQKTTQKTVRSETILHSPT